MPRLFSGLILAGLVALGLSGCAMLQKKQPPVQTGLVIHSYNSPATQTARDFAVYIPPDYNEKAEPWPTMLFLHGYGECGDDINASLQHGPSKEALARGTFPFIVIHPQAPQPDSAATITRHWRNLEPDLQIILDDVHSKYRVDDSRLYLTGLSMGGFGSFALAADWAGKFAAVAPICGGGMKADAEKYTGTPFWVFHGDKDTTVPSSRSKNMVEIMRQLGCDVQFTLYPDADHDSWTETYQNDELYKWMLSHSLEK